MVAHISLLSQQRLPSSIAAADGPQQPPHTGCNAAATSRGSINHAAPAPQAVEHLLMLVRPRGLLPGSPARVITPSNNLWKGNDRAAPICRSSAGRPRLLFRSLGTARPLAARSRLERRSWPDRTFPPVGARYRSRRIVLAQRHRLRLWRDARLSPAAPRQLHIQGHGYLAGYDQRRADPACIPIECQLFDGSRTDGHC